MSAFALTREERCLSPVSKDEARAVASWYKMGEDALLTMRNWEF